MRALEKQLSRFRDNSWVRFPIERAREGYIIVKAQRHAETIETGAKIGSAGWDAESDLLCH